MTLRARLTLGFLAIVVLLLVPTTLLFESLRHVQRATQSIEVEDVSASLTLGRVRRELEYVRGRERVYPFLNDSTDRRDVERAIAELKLAADSLRSYEERPEIAARLNASLDSISAALVELAAAVDAVPQDTLFVDSISRTRTGPAIENAERTVEQAVEQVDNAASLAVREAGGTVERANEVAQVAFILAILFSGAVAIYMARTISRPVRELEQGMAAVASGDFQRRIQVKPDRDDEFGRLALSFKAMSRQLAELDKLKAEFVSVASHELKTPINVILGYLQLLEEGVYGPLTPRQREILGTLMVQGQSLSRLVQQLLDISRFEAGGGKLDVREVELPQFVAELESAFHVLALQRGIAFRVVRGADLPPVVRWDGDRMNEVVGNLLSNAFKFTERGGTVELEVLSTAGNVQMLVRDTGAGIPPSQLPHVFRKFYQADNQEAASLKGTGLGLAIAKEIVEAHGGSITVDSTPGIGTTFCILMPERATPSRRPPRSLTPTEVAG